VKTQDPGDAEIKTQNTRGGQTKTLTTYILVMAVLLVLVIVGSIVFAVHSSNHITANSNNINSTQQTVASLQTQLSSANTTISSLSSQLNAANTQIQFKRCLRVTPNKKFPSTFQCGPGLIT